MRTLSLLFLLLFAGIVAAFAFFNQTPVALRFFDTTTTINIASVVAVAYLLGMLSGWTVIGMVRRSIYRVTDPTIMRNRWARGMW